MAAAIARGLLCETPAGERPRQPRLRAVRLLPLVRRRQSSRPQGGRAPHQQGGKRRLGDLDRPDPRPRGLRRPDGVPRRRPHHRHRSRRDPERAGSQCAAEDAGGAGRAHLLPAGHPPTGQPPRDRPLALPQHPDTDTCARRAAGLAGGTGRHVGFGGSAPAGHLRRRAVARSPLRRPRQPDRLSEPAGGDRLAARYCNRGGGRRGCRRRRGPLVCSAAAVGQRPREGQRRGRAPVFSRVRSAYAPASRVAARWRASRGRRRDCSGRQS